MKMYCVYEAGKRCSEHKIKGWDKDTFETKREAEVFAYHWAYPMPLDACEREATEMELGKEYDYSMCEFPVMMKIEEVDV